MLSCKDNLFGTGIFLDHFTKYPPLTPPDETNLVLELELFLT